VSQHHPGTAGRPNPGRKSRSSLRHARSMQNHGLTTALTQVSRLPGICLRLHGGSMFSIDFRRRCSVRFFFR
jgi:hypothetical protein